MAQVMSLLKDCEKSLIEIYTEEYQQLFTHDNKEEDVKILKEIIVSSDLYFNEKEYKTMSDEEKKLLSKVGLRYYGLLNELVCVIAKENRNTDEFYEKLFSVVFESGFFPETTEERGVILFFLARRIELLPYYQAQSKMTITDDTFRNTIDRISSKLGAAMFMISDRFNTTLEEAIQLYDISKSLKTDEEKAVYWASIISRIKKNESNENRNEQQ